MGMKTTIDKDIVFIASLFNMSISESIAWIKKHTKDEIDALFDEYNEG